MLACGELQRKRTGYQGLQYIDMMKYCLPRISEAVGVNGQKSVLRVEVVVPTMLLDSLGSIHNWG